MRHKTKGHVLGPEEGVMFRGAVPPVRVRRDLLAELAQTLYQSLELGANKGVETRAHLLLYNWRLYQDVCFMLGRPVRDLPKGY